MIVFAGGDPEFFFSRLVADGALAAAKDLGPEVELLWANWERDLMVRQFKEAIEAEPHGIAVMGHPGDAAMAPFVHEARRKGIVVTSLNTELPSMENAYRGEGFGYVGQHVVASARSLAEASIRKFSLQQGDTVLVYGVASYPVRGARTRTAVEVLKAAGLQVVYREHRRADTAEGDTENQLSALQEMLGAHPKAKLLFDDTDPLSAAGGLIDRSNIEEIADLVERGIR